MNVTPREWELTDREIRAVEFRGNNMAEAQRAKRQAFIDNGGIILNPEALTDMYEALVEIAKVLLPVKYAWSRKPYIKICAAISKAEDTTL
ncbi:hypothetical protein LCGC14_1279750 [marine sediment metagenome]|uniref:Uncharacterized protein n=1 Tax=marine sediment metagenome TaxID=412755 RepID=A0A0F9LGT8_9ZZZZ